MTRKTYPSDVTNAEWQIIERLLPLAQATGRPRQVDLREIKTAFDNRRLQYDVGIGYGVAL